MGNRSVLDKTEGQGHLGSVIESALLEMFRWTTQHGVSNKQPSSERDQANIGCTELSVILRIGVIR